MPSPMHRNIDVTMVCGHKDNAPVSYRGSRQLLDERLNLKKMLCHECMGTLSTWYSADFGQQAYPMDFPIMAGTSPAQTKFATDVRRDEFKKFGPIMLALSKDPSELAKFAWRAIYMRFMVTNVRYWLDGRNRFNVHLWATDIQRLMKAPSISDVVSTETPYGWFAKGRNRDALGYIIGINPACDLQGKNLPLMHLWTAEMFRESVSSGDERKAS